MQAFKNLSRQTAKGIAQSNPDTFMDCSSCMKRYGDDRRVVLTKPCNHILCEKCVSKLQNKCFVCNKTYSSLEYAPDNIQQAFKQETPQIIVITVNDTVRKGTNYEIALPVTWNLRKLSKHLFEKKGLLVQTLLIKTKSYKMYQETRFDNLTLKQLSVNNGQIIRTIASFNGGI